LRLAIIEGSYKSLGHHNPDKERFVNEHADEANALATRAYREPFVVPAVR
jgi:hypothetical protein